jgi:hypothetical protein
MREMDNLTGSRSKSPHYSRMILVDSVWLEELLVRTARMLLGLIYPVVGPSFCLSAELDTNGIQIPIQILTRRNFYS